MNKFNFWYFVNMYYLAFDIFWKIIAYDMKTSLHLLGIVNKANRVLSYCSAHLCTRLLSIGRNTAVPVFCIGIFSLFCVRCKQL
jgi:hypothetical protein